MENLATPKEQARILVEAGVMPNEHLDARRVELVDRITTGRLTHDEYLSLCGELRGIQYALQPSTRKARP